MIHKVVTKYPFLHDVYNECIITKDIKPHYKRSGKINEWALDLRIAIAQSKYLFLISDLFNQILIKHNINQIAAKGIGSVALAGGILSKAAYLNAGFIRDEPKQYGFKNLIEGKLNKDFPVMIVDDLLSSGYTCSLIKNILETNGYTVYGIITIFHYADKKYTCPLDVVETLADLYKL